MPMSAVAQSGGSMAAVQPLYENVKGWLIQSAEQMPEEDFSFKPTPEVRSFGELMGHVANATYMFCAGATGEENPNSTDFEEVTSKAALVAALTGAFEFCDTAYQMPDAKALEEVTFFGRTGTRLWVLTFNVTHNWEHYGNVVTYMRLKGMVPPSSQRGM
jgi:uncharacterized damage-inducible protein DinB